MKLYEEYTLEVMEPVSITASIITILGAAGATSSSLLRLAKLTDEFTDLVEEVW